MARIRTIKPEFWGHPKVSRISRDARLLFLGLLNEADDEGLLLGSTKRIAGVVFPHDEDVTAKKIERWLDELQLVCLVQRYRVEGTAYVSLCGFTEHQKISHPTPSRLPSPSRETLELFDPDLGIDLGTRKGTTLNGASAVPDSRVSDLVAGYVEDYQSEREGHAPPPRWRGAAGRAAKEALAAGESVKDIAGCFYVIAHEGKNPNTLNYVLADSHAGRERRIK